MPLPNAFWLDRPDSYRIPPRRSPEGHPDEGFPRTEMLAQVAGVAD
jgi:hypothetical protein